MVCLSHCSGISKKRGKEDGERLEFVFPLTNRQPVLVLAALVFPLMSQFYILLKQIYQSWDSATVLLPKRKYDQICQFCMDWQDGAYALAKVLEGNLQVYF